MPSIPLAIVGGAAHCGFEQDQPEAFYVTRDANVGLDEDVGAAQQALAIRVIDLPEHVNPIAEALRRDGAPELDGYGSIAGDEIRHVGGRWGSTLPTNHADSLAPNEPSQRHQDDLVVADVLAVAAGCPLPPVGSADLSSEP